MAECGTYAGCQQHRKRGETPCDPCKEAMRTYMREWRKRPGKDMLNRLRTRALNRALADLAKAHPVEYQMLAEVRMWEVGLR